MYTCINIHGIYTKHWKSREASLFPLHQEKHTKPEVGIGESRVPAVPIYGMPRVQRGAVTNSELYLLDYFLVVMWCNMCFFFCWTLLTLQGCTVGRCNLGVPIKVAKFDEFSLFCLQVGVIHSVIWWGFCTESWFNHLASPRFVVVVVVWVLQYPGSFQIQHW